MQSGMNSSLLEFVALLDIGSINVRVRFLCRLDMSKNHWGYDRCTHTEAKQKSRKASLHKNRTCTLMEPIYLTKLRIDAIRSLLQFVVL